MLKKRLVAIFAPLMLITSVNSQAALIKSDCQFSTNPTVRECFVDNTVPKAYTEATTLNLFDTVTGLKTANQDLLTTSGLDFANTSELMPYLNARLELDFIALMSPIFDGYYKSTATLTADEWLKKYDPMRHAPTSYITKNDANGNNYDASVISLDFRDNYVYMTLTENVSQDMQAFLNPTALLSSTNFTQVPEPSTLAIFAFALFGFFGARYLKRHKTA